MLGILEDIAASPNFERVVFLAAVFFLCRYILRLHKRIESLHDRMETYLAEHSRASDIVRVITERGKDNGTD